MSACGFEEEEDAARARDALALVGGYPAEALNFGVRDAQNLLLCTLAVANQR